MSEDAIPEWPHKPAPPEPRQLLPERPMLTRGLGLGLLAASLAAAAAAGLRRVGMAGVVVALPLAVCALLAAWAAAIHLTGGERFDDHPWV